MWVGGEWFFRQHCEFEGRDMAIQSLLRVLTLIGLALQAALGVFAIFPLLTQKVTGCSGFWASEFIRHAAPADQAGEGHYQIPGLSGRTYRSGKNQRNNLLIVGNFPDGGQAGGVESRFEKRTIKLFGGL